MEYKAKIIKTNQTQPGLYKFTFAYTNQQGEQQAVDCPEEQPLNPWDAHDQHPIIVHYDGSWCTYGAQNLRVLYIVLAAVIGFFCCIPLFIFAPDSIAFCITLAFISAMIAFCSIKEIKLVKHRKTRAKQIPLTTATIVSYQKQTTTSSSTGQIKTRYYPVVEYQYNEQICSAVLEQHEQPHFVGATRKIYVDMQHKEVFSPVDCEYSFKNHGIWLLLSAVLACASIWTLTL